MLPYRKERSSAAAVPEPIAFLSYDVRNNQRERNEFIRQLNETEVKLTIEDSSPRGELPVSDSLKLLRGNIGRSRMMIVLVGTSTADAEAVAEEIEVAKDRNVPYFGVYVDGADESTELPPDLPRNRTIPWDWMRIEAAIKQLLAEGKNHTFA